MRGKKPVQFERSHIDISDTVQLRYWSKHFGVSCEELRSAVQKVGSAAPTVRKELVARNAVAAEAPLNRRASISQNVGASCYASRRDRHQPERP